MTKGPKRMQMKVAPERWQPIFSSFSFTTEDRFRFSDELGKLVEADHPDAATRFIEAVEEALVSFDLHRKAIEGQIAGTKKLDDFADYARRAADALSETDRATALAIAFGAGPRGNCTASVDDIEADVERLKRLARAAKAYLSKNYPRPGGNALSPELSSLLVEISRAYASSFGCRPSYSEGPFTKTLKVIFDLTKLGQAPEKSALKRILKNVAFDGLPPLRRGRKKKRK